MHPFNPPTQRWATLAPAAAPPHLKAGLTCAAHALARSPANANALCRTSALGSYVSTWRGVGGWEGWVGHYRMLHLVWVQLHLVHESHHTGRGDEWSAAYHVWETACRAPSSGGKRAVAADSPPAQCAPSGGTLHARPCEQRRGRFAIKQNKFNKQIVAFNVSAHLAAAQQQFPHGAAPHQALYGGAQPLRHACTACTARAAGDIH